MDKSETLPYRPSDNVSGGQESMNRSLIQWQSADSPSIGQLISH